MKFIILLFVIMFTSCTGLQYEDDEGYNMPVPAGSLESLVMIGDKPCVDMDGEVGICSKRLSSDADLVLKLTPKPYPYNINVTCSSNINFNESFDIPQKTEFSITVPSSKFFDKVHFICVGTIKPLDEREFVLTKFEVRVRVVQADYVKRSNIFAIKHKGKQYLILGEHNKYSMVFRNGKWLYYNKRPTLLVDGHNLNEIKVISESKIGRMSYFNF